MSKNKKTKRRRSKRRTSLNLLDDIELDLYLACMDLDKKRKRRDYIV